MLIVLLLLFLIPQNNHNQWI